MIISSVYFLYGLLLDNQLAASRCFILEKMLDGVLLHVFYLVAVLLTMGVGCLASYLRSNRKTAIMLLPPVLITFVWSVIFAMSMVGTASYFLLAGFLLVGIVLPLLNCIALSILGSANRHLLGVPIAAMAFGTLVSKGAVLLTWAFMSFVYISLATILVGIALPKLRLPIKVKFMAAEEDNPRALGAPWQYQAINIMSFVWFSNKCLFKDNLFFIRPVTADVLLQQVLIIASALGTIFLMPAMKNRANRVLLVGFLLEALHIAAITTLHLSEASIWTIRILNGLATGLILVSMPICLYDFAPNSVKPFALSFTTVTALVAETIFHYFCTGLDALLVTHCIYVIKILNFGALVAAVALGCLPKTLWS